MLKTITAIAVVASIPMLFAGSSSAVAQATTDVDKASIPQVTTTPIRKPIAYGYINKDGSVASGSGNFTSTFDATNKWYAIKITGKHYFFTNFSTVVTPSFNSSVVAPTCGTGSVSGLLLIACYNTAGARVQPAAGLGFGVF